MTVAYERMRSYGRARLRSISPLVEPLESRDRFAENAGLRFQVGLCDETDSNPAKYCKEMVRPTGFEPVAFRSGGGRSIQLSYGRKERLPGESVAAEEFKNGAPGGI
jgi:hypothetical protein